MIRVTGFDEKKKTGCSTKTQQAVGTV